ncbi:MAG: single-stranded-DNA-specific exonuclease RecJ [Thermodesulfobacteriota bacterium]|nr:single-stranded-DNA-specific exonuclease RecJ [Thermodesulfobacteriota bacterium]
MQPIIKRLWTERIIAEEVDEAGWCASLKISPLVCRLLLLRGVTTVAEAHNLLTGTLSSLPDPFLLAGMDAAVSRLVEAIGSGEKIAIHGDYDVDGITGTAMLCDGLRQFGAVVEYYIPLRMRDGYGLSDSAIRTCASNGVKLLLSVDCGISALEEASLAAELGLDLIITDHHQPLATLPQALACIDPWQSHCNYPDKKLSGVGVAFMLIIALRSRLREVGQLSTPEPDIRYLLDLVAMGTIADLVPLHGVNRVLVQTGLRLLERGERFGINALKRVADVRQMSAGVVGFKLAPRLNAAGRLDDASLGVQLLLSDQQAQADALAQQLHAFNSQRQAIERQVLEQVLERVDGELSDGQRTIVLADERWHSGVIGIVASRVVDRFHRPTVLIALEDGVGKGSARSISGFHLFNAFQQCSRHLMGFGGHEYAAGLSVQQVDVDEFAEAFEQYAQQSLADNDLLPVRCFDAEILLQDLDRNLYDEMQTLAPFGAGNPEPLLMCSNVRVQNPSIVGEKHIRFTVQQDGYSHPCIAFGLAERLGSLNGSIDILFNLSLNCWRDRETLQLQVKDFRATQF